MAALNLRLLTQYFRACPLVHKPLVRCAWVCTGVHKSLGTLGNAVVLRHGGGRDAPAEGADHADRSLRFRVPEHGNLRLSGRLRCSRNLLPLGQFAHGGDGAGQYPFLRA
jgi:hypothetical protein